MKFSRRDHANFTYAIKVNGIKEAYRNNDQFEKLETLLNYENIFEKSLKHYVDIRGGEIRKFDPENVDFRK